MILGKLLFLCL